MARNNCNKCNAKDKSSEHGTNCNSMNNLNPRPFVNVRGALHRPIPGGSTRSTERACMNYPTRNEMVLDNKRNGTRVDHERTCFLSHRGITYRCEMKNISLSGALVSALDFASSAMQVGDECGLFLSAESTMCPIEYTSRVARLDSSNIALQFLGMTF